LRILFLTHALPRFAGDRVTVFIRSLACAFKEKGHDLVVMAPFHPDLDCAYQRSLYKFEPFHYFPVHRWERLGYSKGMSDGLHQNKRNFMLGPFFILAGIVACCRLTRRIKPDLIFANWGIPSGLFGAIASRISGVPLVVSFPGADVTIISSGFFYRCAGRYVGKRARALATNSSDLRDALVKSGLPGHKLRYVIYGADKSEFEPDPALGTARRRHLGISPDKIVIGSIGRFVAKKGFEYLVDCAKIVLDRDRTDERLVFVLFGEGENEKTLRDRIERLGLTQRFFLPGPVPPEDLRGVYNCFDIFVNPAVRKPVDGLNVVVVEAMACGKPIVATNVCGNDIVVQDGKNGLLVPEKDAAALAQAVVSLADDRDTRLRMGIDSRSRFEEKFTWDRIVDRYCDLVTKGT
jgi:glycosyltransferase involved in cell wall biosynthesis